VEPVDEPQEAANVLTFSDFMDKVVKQEVADVLIARDELTGTLKNDDGQGVSRGGAASV
jgi:hypothetical protein